MKISKIITTAITTGTCFTLFFTISACSNTQKPSYILTDSELHQYQSGDQLTYSVLSLTGNADITGTLSHKFTTTDLILPSLQTLETLTQTTNTENITFPFAIPNFTQQENGNLILQAYTESGNTYWLNKSLDENNTGSTGEVFHPSPLSEISTPTSFNSTLLTCDKNTNLCLNGGDTNLYISTPIIENIETPYAKFEAYKFAIE